MLFFVLAHAPGPSIFCKKIGDSERRRPGTDLGTRPAQLSLPWTVRQRARGTGRRRCTRARTTHAPSPGAHQRQGKRSSHKKRQGEKEKGFFLSVVLHVWAMTNEGRGPRGRIVQKQSYNVWAIPLGVGAHRNAHSPNMPARRGREALQRHGEGHAPAQGEHARRRVRSWMA